MSKFRAKCKKPTSTLTKNKVYFVEENRVWDSWFSIDTRYKVQNDKGNYINVTLDRFTPL